MYMWAGSCDAPVDALGAPDALQGVEVMHGGMVNVLHDYGDDVCVPTSWARHGDRTLLNLNFYFDASALDIWLPLSRGCSIVILPGDAGRDPANVCQAISDYSIVAFTTVPAQLQVGFMCSRSDMKARIVCHDPRPDSEAQRPMQWWGSLHLFHVLCAAGLPHGSTRGTACQSTCRHLWWRSAQPCNRGTGSQAGARLQGRQCIW
jgi:AMP-binding enzyme